MKSLGRRSTIAIAVVACLAVLASGWFLLVKPVKKDISAVKSQTVEQLANNASLQLQVARMRTVAKNLPAELAELATLTQRVPDQVQLPALLRTMQSVAKDSGVALKGIAPSLPVPLAAAPGIESVAIVLNVSGGYAELEQFDTALEGLKRTFQVSSFTMSGGAATSATSADITATFTGRVLLHGTAAAATTAGH